MNGDRRVRSLRHDVVARRSGTMRGNDVRVAYANVRAGVLCLGDPGGRHVRVLADGLDVVGRVTSARDGAGHGEDSGADGDQGYDEDDAGYDEDDAYEDAEHDGAAEYDEERDDEPDDEDPGEGSGGIVAWADLLALEADAPSTRWRYPGVLSTVLAAVVGTIGIDGHTDGAELDVEITTWEGVEVVRCDGFAGRGYWAPHLQAVQVLLRLLVGDRTTRPWLEAPAELLGVVASIARGGPTDEALADELRAALRPGPPVR